MGSVRQLVNPAGTVTQARNFEPFGKSLSTAGNPLTKYGFTAEWTDPTNLIYLRARYYDPATGRFLSKDPVRGLIAHPSTLNLYSYAVNNPINFIDPSGLSNRPGDPPPPTLDILYWARNLLISWDVDAVGWRLNFSGGDYVGGSLNIDILYHLQTEKAAAFVSFGPQGYDVGISGSTGVLLIWGLSDLQGYTGWSGGPTCSFAERAIGVDASLTFAKDIYNGERPMTFYLGYAGGEEITFGLTSGYTWPWAKVARFFGQMLK